VLYNSAMEAGRVPFSYYSYVITYLLTVVIHGSLDIKLFDIHICKSVVLPASPVIDAILIQL